MIMHDGLNPNVDKNAVSMFMDFEGRHIELKGKVLKEPRYLISTDRNGNLRATGGYYGQQSAVDVQVSNDLKFNGNAYITINKNVPSFTQAEIDFASSGQQFKLSNLDHLGRAGAAILVTDEVYNSNYRDSLQGIELPGFNQKAYSFITGGWLYNRCHLLAYSLSDIHGTEQYGVMNLVTGTQFLNQSMNDMEKAVADYINHTKNHVIYKAIPHYTGNNLVCDGIQLMAQSVEDGGKFYFNRFYFNVQPGVCINYADGTSYADKDAGIYTDNDKTNNELGAGTSNSNINPDSPLKDVYDFPILQKEALMVLNGILEYVYNRLKKTNSSDLVQNAADLKGTKVVLTSALRVNSNYKDIGAGFSFCLQGKGQLGNGELFKVLEQYYHEEYEKLNEIKKYKSGYYEDDDDYDIRNNGNSELPCFEVTKLKANDEVRIKVRPIVAMSMSGSGTVVKPNSGGNTNE